MWSMVYTPSLKKMLGAPSYIYHVPLIYPPSPSLGLKLVQMHVIFNSIKINIVYNEDLETLTQL